MSWTGVAIAGGAIVGSMISSQGAQSAASTQAGAAENAQQISAGEFNTITGQEQPFMRSGYGAMNQLDYLLGIGNPSDYRNSGNAFANTGNYGGFGGFGGGGNFVGGRGSPIIEDGGKFGGRNFGGAGGTGGLRGGSLGNMRPQGGKFTSPGGAFGSLLQPFNVADWKQLSPMYNFERQQGMQGVLNGSEANMGALSGAAQKDLMGYNQALANTSFNNAFNMYQTQQGNIYDRLAGVMQMGQAAAANTGQQGTALAGQAAQSATNVGTALAAGQVGAANAYGNAASTIGFMPWLMAGNQQPQNASSADTGGYPPQ